MKKDEICQNKDCSWYFDDVVNNCGKGGLNPKSCKKERMGLVLREKVNTTKLTDDQKSSIIAAYQSMYDVYLKCKRSRDLNFKKIAVPHWKKRLKDFQSVTTNILKIEVEFKSLDQ